MTGPATEVADAIVISAVLPLLPRVKPDIDASVTLSSGHERPLVKLVDVGSTVSIPVLLIFKDAPDAILRLSPCKDKFPEVTVDDPFQPK